MLCILTSFQMLSIPEIWLKHLFGRFQLLLLILDIFCAKSSKKQEKMSEKTEFLATP